MRVVQGIKFQSTLFKNLSELDQFIMDNVIGYLLRVIIAINTLYYETNHILFGNLSNCYTFNEMEHFISIT